jgi:WD40 repeat protein
VPEEQPTFAAHKGPVDVLAFTPDGKTLVTGGDDHLVRSWDVTAAEPREKVVPKGPVGGLNAIAFAPDGKTLAVGGYDQVVRLWDLAETRPGGQAPAPKAELTARSPVQSLAFSPDGKTLACGDEVWGLVGAEFAIHWALGRDDTWSLAYAPDGKTLISGGHGQKVRLWDMTGDGPRLRHTISDDRPAPGEDGNPLPRMDRTPASRVAISPDGKFLAFSVEGSKGDSVRLCDLSGDKPRERATLQGTGWPISSLAFAPDGKTLAAGTNGGTLLWDLSQDAPRALRTIKDCLGFSMAFSRDGTRLIAADEVMTSGKPLDPSRPAVCVYEVATGKRLHEWNLSAPCWAIALAPDGRHVAAAKQDGTVDILRLPPAR